MEAYERDCRECSCHETEKLPYGLTGPVSHILEKRSLKPEA